MNKFILHHLDESRHEIIASPLVFSANGDRFQLSFCAAACIILDIPCLRPSASWSGLDGEFVFHGLPLPRCQVDDQWQVSGIDSPIPFQSFSPVIHISL